MTAEREGNAKDMHDSRGRAFRRPTRRTCMTAGGRAFRRPPAQPAGPQRSAITRINAKNAKDMHDSRGPGISAPARTTCGGLSAVR